MYLPIYYITSRRLALKSFTGLLDYDLSVLGVLYEYDKPCYYKRLHGLLVQCGYYMTESTLTNVLKRGVASGYIIRNRVVGNVCYSITLEGKRLLHSFAMVLDSIVAERVRIRGNGFNFE